jgi:SAM-dependent methyltransferase
VQLERVNVNRPTDLCRIMRRHGSDKGMGQHNYTTLYRTLFAPWRESRVRLLELGLGTNNPTLASSMGVTGRPGASLRGWAEFFPLGDIVGADIDREILFNQGRIITFYCDQRNAISIGELWANPLLGGEFDIVIEDGLHTFDANVSFFEGSLHKVRKGGYYVIEDINRNDLPRWRELIPRKYTIVALSVWLMLGKKRRPLIRLQKRITLIAAIAIGFWVCTTAALRFADSSGTEDGAGATSVVTVGPRGSQEGPEEIMLGGIVSSIGGAALAIGTLKMRSRIHRVRRRRSKSLNVSRPTEVPSSVEASSWVEASTPAPSLL